jgi:hypothetical protein
VVKSLFGSLHLSCQQTLQYEFSKYLNSFINIFSGLGVEEKIGHFEQRQKKKKRERIESKKKTEPENGLSTYKVDKCCKWPEPVCSYLLRSLSKCCST